MTNDEIGVETEMAGLLDELAGELNGIAEQLRRKPFAAIREQLQRQGIRLGLIQQAGQFLMAEDLARARTSLCQLDDGTVEADQQAAKRSNQRLEQRRQRRQERDVAETTAEA